MSCAANAEDAEQRLRALGTTCVGPHGPTDGTTVAGPTQESGPGVAGVAWHRARPAGATAGRLLPVLIPSRAALELVEVSSAWCAGLPPLIEAVLARGGEKAPAEPLAPEVQAKDPEPSLNPDLAVAPGVTDRKQ